MLVRSPTLTNSESPVTVSGSRPDSRSAGRRCGPARAAPCPRRPPRWPRCGRGWCRSSRRARLTRPLHANSSEDRGGLVGCLVVLAERVGQTGVGVAGDEGVGDPGELGDVRPHLGGAERAVQADGERAGVPHGVPERLGDLAGQGAAGRVGDGAGDDHRPAAAALLEERLEGEDRRLGVEGVEDRLDQQQVGAAVDEALRLLEVGLDEPVVGDVALARVVDVRRDRRGRVGGAERADDPAGPVRGLGGDRVARLAGQPGGREVHLVGEVLHAVVGLGDQLGAEGVGLDEVGAGLEVLGVDRADHVGLGQAQQVGVAAHVLAPVGEALAAEVVLARGRAAGSSCPWRRP